MSRHGTHSTYSRGCRCEGCREAHRIYTAQRRAVALAEGTLSHGLRGTYDAGCRCQKCRDAKHVAYATNAGEYPAKTPAHRFRMDRSAS